MILLAYKHNTPNIIEHTLYTIHHTPCRRNSRDASMPQGDDMGSGMSIGMGMGASGMLHALSAEGYEFILKGREIYPGSILGLEKIFIDKNNASLDTAVVCV
ncbi:hypothetical protein EON63_13300 [archaeon]|nr:MAG: hypothetical protein EON63_13300 [archaeon]